MGVNGPDSNAVQGFNKLWQEASVHNVEKGQTSGINKEEFDGMSLFLNDAINNENSSDETKQWARQKLNDLDTMKNSVFNNLFNNSCLYSFIDIVNTPVFELIEIKPVSCRTLKTVFP